MKKVFSKQLKPFFSKKETASRCWRLQAFCRTAVDKYSGQEVDDEHGNNETCQGKNYRTCNFILFGFCVSMLVMVTVVVVLMMMSAHLLRFFEVNIRGESRNNVPMTAPVFSAVLQTV